jgi:F0F1-type ATP synthase membrane subunit a
VLGTLNLGNHTLTLNASSGKVLEFNTTIGGTGTVNLVGDGDIEISTACSTATQAIPNLIMQPITANRTVSLGHGGCKAIIQVDGNFISGSSPSAMVSFVKGDSNSNIANSVTSYYCASNGGITNIDCQPCGPTGCSSPPPSTPVAASVESDLALALTFLGIVLFAAFKMRKTRKV